MRVKKLFLLSAAALGAAMCAAADPIAVTYGATGSAGNWTLDFTVNNNLSGAPDQALYLFGVVTSAPDVVGSPAGYDPTLIGAWDNSSFGGSSTLYNNVWEDPSMSQLLPASSLSGFEVHLSDAILPQTVQWFAFTFGSTQYLGGGNFNDNFNPGFEGTATLVPEPGTTVLLTVGLAGLWFARKRRRA
jgi:hypothetical protein